MQTLRAEGYELCAAAGGPFGAAEMAGRLRGVSAAIVGADDLGAGALAGADRLIILAKNGTGVDNIDVAAATARGVLVTSAPDTNTQAVADLVFGLALAGLRNLVASCNSLRGGKWEVHVGRELWGKTLGLVGCGRIGRAVAKRARGFDLGVLAYDLHRDEAWAKESGVTYVDLHVLARESDLVSVHLPLTPETRGLIGEGFLAEMKPSAFLINTARGPIVDEEALYAALRQGRILGAGLDVYATEPPIGSPLLALENVVCTPHMGGHTVEANLRTGLAVARSVIQALKGEVPQNCLNPEALSVHRLSEERERGRERGRVPDGRR